MTTAHNSNLPFIVAGTELRKLGCDFRYRPVANFVNSIDAIDVATALNDAHYGDPA